VKLLSCVGLWASGVGKLTWGWVGSREVGRLMAHKGGQLTRALSHAARAGFGLSGARA
jgi:hypothetical protein